MIAATYISNVLHRGVAVEHSEGSAGSAAEQCLACRMPSQGSLPNTGRTPQEPAQSPQQEGSQAARDTEALTTSPAECPGQRRPAQRASEEAVDSAPQRGRGPGHKAVRAQRLCGVAPSSHPPIAVTLQGLFSGWGWTPAELQPSTRPGSLPFLLHGQIVSYLSSRWLVQLSSYFRPPTPCSAHRTPEGGPESGVSDAHTQFLLPRDACPGMQALLPQVGPPGSQGSVPEPRDGDARASRSPGRVSTDHCPLPSAPSSILCQALERAGQEPDLSVGKPLASRGL